MEDSQRMMRERLEQWKKLRKGRKASNIEKTGKGGEYRTTHRGINRDENEDTSNDLPKQKFEKIRHVSEKKDRDRKARENRTPPTVGLGSSYGLPETSSSARRKPDSQRVKPANESTAQSTPKVVVKLVDFSPTTRSAAPRSKRQVPIRKAQGFEIRTPTPTKKKIQKESAMSEKKISRATGGEADVRATKTEAPVIPHSEPMMKSKSLIIEESTLSEMILIPAGISELTSELRNVRQQLTFEQTANSDILRELEDSSVDTEDEAKLDETSEDTKDDVKLDETSEDTKDDVKLDETSEDTKDDVKLDESSEDTKDEAKVDELSVDDIKGNNKEPVVAEKQQAQVGPSAAALKAKIELSTQNKLRQINLRVQNKERALKLLFRKRVRRAAELAATTALEHINRLRADFASEAPKRRNELRAQAEAEIEAFKNSFEEDRMRCQKALQLLRERLKEEKRLNLSKRERKVLSDEGSN